MLNDQIVQLAQHARCAEPLHNAGWFPARRINTSQWESWYRREGYVEVDYALQILSILGGLTIRPVHSHADKYFSGAAYFSPIDVADDEIDRINDRCLVTNSRYLTPIGEWTNEYILLVSDVCKIYAETTFQVIKLGNSFGEGLRNILIPDKPLLIIDGKRPL